MAVSQCQPLEPCALPALECLGLSCEFLHPLMQMDTAQLQCALGSERLGVWAASITPKNRFLSFKPLILQLEQQ